jgi:hypothetical protein
MRQKRFQATYLPEILVTPRQIWKERGVSATQIDDFALFQSRPLG